MDYNISQEIRQPFLISDCLSVGKENAHTATEIAGWKNVSPRDITKAIERERQDGIPICATCNSEHPGYFLAQDAAELAAYLQSFKRRRRNMARTEDALNATLCKYTGQMRMELSRESGE